MACGALERLHSGRQSQAASSPKLKVRELPRGDAGDAWLVERTKARRWSPLEDSGGIDYAIN
jgi:hypothetical protein